MKKIAIIGLGWLGKPLAEVLIKEGNTVIGTKTSYEMALQMSEQGIPCVPLKLTPELACHSDCLYALFHHTDVAVITLPPSKLLSEPGYYLAGIKNILPWIIQFSIPRLIFTSSTGVYGQQDGVLTEESLLNGTSRSGRVLIDVEQYLLSQTAFSVDILRLAGLVGKSRHTGHFLAGKSTVSNPLQLVNLVHQEDVINAIVTLLGQPEGGHIYNVCAPQHPTRYDFYRITAKRLDLPEPKFDKEEIPATRVVDGSRIYRELGGEYCFPDPNTMPMF